MNEEERARALAALSGGTPGAPLPAAVQVPVNPETQARHAVQAQRAATPLGAMPAPGDLEQRSTPASDPGAMDRPELGQQERYGVQAVRRLPGGQVGIVVGGRAGEPVQIIRAPADPASWAAVLNNSPYASSAARLTEEALSRFVPEPAAPTGPRAVLPGREQYALSTTETAPVTPETQALLQQTGADFATAQSGAQAQERRQFEIAADAQRQMAEAQAAEQARQVEAERARQAQINDRMAAFDNTIRRVQEQRIDPEGFFGGDFGRRIGAGILVALGQFAAGLTGGENAALGIINRAIDRNLESQRANMQNAREGARLEGQALSQFQNLLGDERAAEDAARAAHLAAVQSRLQGMIASARPDQVASLQKLSNAIQAAQAAAQQAAADRGRWSIERSFSVDRRVSPSTAMRSAAAAQTGMLSPREVEERLTRQRALGIAAQGSGPRASATRRRSARGREQALSGLDILRRPITAENIDEAREQLRNAQETRAATSAPDVAIGGMFDIDEGMLRSQLSDATARTALREAVASAAAINRIISQAEQIREGRGIFAQMTDVDTNETLRALGQEATFHTRRMQNFGAMNGPGEQEIIADLIGTFDQSDLGDFLRMESTPARLRALRQMTNRAVEGWAPYGVTFRSPENRGNAAGGVVPPAPQDTAPPPQRGVSERSGGVTGATAGFLSGVGFGPIPALAGAVGGYYGGSRAFRGND